MAHFSYSWAHIQRTPYNTMERFTCHIYWCFIHYSKELQSTQLSINTRMDNENWCMWLERWLIT